MADNRPKTRNSVIIAVIAAFVASSAWWFLRGSTTRTKTDKQPAAVGQGTSASAYIPARDEALVPLATDAFRRTGEIAKDLRQLSAADRAALADAAGSALGVVLSGDAARGTRAVRDAGGHIPDDLLADLDTLRETYTLNAQAYEKGSVDVESVMLVPITLNGKPTGTSLPNLRGESWAPADRYPALDKIYTLTNNAPVVRGTAVEAVVRVKANDLEGASHDVLLGIVLARSPAPDASRGTRWLAVGTRVYYDGPLEGITPPQP